MKNIFFILFIILFKPLISRASSYFIEKNIIWNNPVLFKIDDNSSKLLFSFKNVRYDDKNDFLPLFSDKIKINYEKVVKINLIDIEYENLNKDSISNISGFNKITNHLDFKFNTK